MRKLMLLILLFLPAFLHPDAKAGSADDLNTIQQTLEAGPDSDFHKAGGRSDTFAAALKNPFVGNSRKSSWELRMLIFFSVLTIMIFLRLWKNSIARKEKGSQS